MKCAFDAGVNSSKSNASARYNVTEEKRNAVRATGGRLYRHPPSYTEKTISAAGGVTPG